MPLSRGMKIFTFDPSDGKKLKIFNFGSPGPRKLKIFAFDLSDAKKLKNSKLARLDPGTSRFLH